LLDTAEAMFFACFNPRTYTRCDIYGYDEVINPYPFQSTHLHEVRLLLRCERFNFFLCFNPRTCTRCDSDRHRTSC